MSRFDLVIFDCDGVLVDSERLSNQVFADMLGEIGMPVTLEHMFEHFMGNSMKYCMGRVADMLGHAPPDEFAERYRERVNAAFMAELRAVEGIEAALDQIRLPVCVASSGDQAKMRTTLGITGLLPRFEGRLFSATEVARSKPWPDVFLHAAKTMSVSPERCVVVEDSPTGTKAAVAAGMTVLGYAAMTPAARLLAAGAHTLFDNMRQLPQLVEPVA